MGYIKEPTGVDFIIKSEPLTKEQEAMISKYIRDYKMKEVKLGTEHNRTRKHLTAKKKVVA